MKCHFCGDTNSKYVCDEHSKTMLNAEDFKKACTNSCDVVYRNKKDEPFYDIEDVRKSYTYNVLQNHQYQLKPEMKDAFFRFKNTTEVYYQNKLIREQRRSAIENFARIAINKLDLSHFPEYEATLDRFVNQLTDEKFTSPADCALRIYNTFDSHIQAIVAKKFREELGINFLNTCSEEIKNDMLKGRHLQQLIDGKIQYDAFVVEVTKYIQSVERRKLLSKAIDERIPEEYRSSCKSTMIFSSFVSNGSDSSVDGTIRFLEFVIMQQQKKKKKGLRNADMFFDSF